MNVEIVDKPKNSTKKWIGIALLIIAFALVFIAGSDYFSNTMQFFLRFIGVLIGPFAGAMLVKAKR